MNNPTAADILREIIRANDDAPGYGMRDQCDNDGDWYQSADLANWMLVARKHLSALSPAPDGDYVLEPMPACDDREPYGIADYEESDDEWCSRNPEMVTWLIDNHAAIRAMLAARSSTPTPEGVGK